MSENTIKIDAIVVKAKQSGENDKLLTLLSPTEGRISVLAKGVRSLKHKSRNACAPLCYSSFVLKKIKDGFYSLVSADLNESFSALSSDVELLSYGAYFCSLCEMCVQAGTEAVKEVRLLLNTLYVLCKRKDSASLIKAVFEFKIMELCGIVPEFSTECPCGEKGNYFSVSDGEIRCALHKTQDAIMLNDAQLRLALYITQSPLKEALYCSYDTSVCDSLASVTEPFLHYHLGKLPDSLVFLHQILIKKP